MHRNTHSFHSQNQDVRLVTPMNSSREQSVCEAMSKYQRVRLCVRLCVCVCLVSHHAVPCVGLTFPTEIPQPNYRWRRVATVGDVTCVCVCVCVCVSPPPLPPLTPTERPLMADNGGIIFPESRSVPMTECLGGWGWGFNSPETSGPEGFL